MLDADQIVERVRETIASIYKRPRMHGITADEIDGVLWHFHRLLRDILEVGEDRFHEALRSIHADGHVCNTSFAHHFRTHTEAGAQADEGEAIDFVIQAWKRMDAKLGVVLPAI